MNPVDLFKSSVLRLNHQEDGCEVCQFLTAIETNSVRHLHQDVLLRVIEILDWKLDEQERLFRQITKGLMIDLDKKPEDRMFSWIKPATEYHRANGDDLIKALDSVELEQPKYPPGHFE